MKAKKISVGFMEFYRGNQEERIIGLSLLWRRNIYPLSTFCKAPK